MQVFSAEIKNYILNRNRKSQTNQQKQHMEDVSNNASGRIDCQVRRRRGPEASGGPRPRPVRHADDQIAWPPQLLRIVKYIAASARRLSSLNLLAIFQVMPPTCLLESQRSFYTFNWHTQPTATAEALNARDDCARQLTPYSLQATAISTHFSTTVCHVRTCYS